MAPRKLAVVASLVRGKPVGAAIGILTYTPRAAAKPVKKLLESAVANATDLSKGAVDIDKLMITHISVDQGPTSRRYLPRAMGRATRMNKKTSHVHVVLSDGASVKAAPKSEPKAKAPKAKAEAKGAKSETKKKA
jgi:large subunit ribosomal protein L22